MIKLMIKINVNGLFKYLVTMGTVDDNIQEQDFYIS